MDNRTVIAVNDDDDETLPQVDLRFLNKTIIEGGNADPFSRSAEDLHGLRGNSPALKRRVTGEIKKYQRSLDEKTSTKQIIDKEFLTGYDMYGVVEPPMSLDALTKLYEVSSPHYAAVNAKVSNIVGLGYRFVESRKTKRTIERLSDNKEKMASARRRLDKNRDDLLDLSDSLNGEEGLTEILTKVWRDYEVTGNGYIEVGRKKDGTVGYLGHIPSKTMRIRRLRDGFVQMNGFDVQFFAPYGAGIDPESGNPRPIKNPIGNDRPHEVIHIMNYSPTSGYYGIPDITAAIHAVAGNKFASQFNLDYFENKAVPRYIITLKGARLGADSEKALLEFFEASVKGQNHRSLYLPLPPDTSDNKVEFKMEAVEAGVQDASFNNYRKSNISDILMVHRVPITKVSVGDSVSLAIARDADKTFKEQVCAPLQRNIERKLSRLFHEFSDAFDFKLNEMTLTDADTQSKIDERMVKNGIWTPNEPRVRDGMPALPGGDKPVDLTARAAQTRSEARTTRQRDSERSAGATDSAGEARNPKGEGRTTG